MTEFIYMGGTTFTVPILLLGILVLALAGLAFARLGADDADRTRRRASLITHVGLFAFVYGVLGQALGLYQAMGAIEQAGAVSPAMMAGGLKVSMIPTLMGLAVFVIALITRIGLAALADRR